MRRALVSILSAAALFGQAGPAKFAEHTVATGLRGGYQVLAVDVNHDGKPDLVALASGLTELVWFENPGWQKHVIVGGLRAPINVTVVKRDANGLPVFAIADEFSPRAKDSRGVVSLLEPGADANAEWKRTEIDRLPTSHRLRMANGVLVNAPLTNADAVAPDYRGHVPLVFYKPGEWKRQLITDADEGVLHCIYITDWDGDGVEDILTASFQGVYWLKGSKTGTWARTQLAAGSPEAWPKSGASDVAVGHLGREKFLATIEPWHGNEVGVYTEKNGKWERQVIDTEMVDGHALLTADLDGNKRDVIVAGYRGKGASVNLYRFDGKQWTKTPLDAGGMAAAGCATADFNGDGKLDVACIGTSTANLKWYENLGNR